MFRRFGRFYVGEQTDGEYEYIWVCKTPADSSYRLPRAFFHKGEPHWNYVDIGAYEGGTDTVGGALVLTSKSGYTPAVNISRRDAFGAAKACGAKCGADGERELHNRFVGDNGDITAAIVHHARHKERTFGVRRRQ